jgi:hypothetical protein
MHNFSELVERSTVFAISNLKRVEAQVHEALQTSGATSLVKTLQMLSLHRAVNSVGMFSLFDAMVQATLGCADGFAKASEVLAAEGEEALAREFSAFILAINVLKHGRGRSYDALLSSPDPLPFRVLRPDEPAFFEGDVSEVTTLIEADDAFVLRCARVIGRVSEVINRRHPGCGL